MKEAGREYKLVLSLMITKNVLCLYTACVCGHLTVQFDVDRSSCAR